MNWKLIDKSKTKQPKSGKYSSWKPRLAREGFFQCVYCSIHETPMGGIRNFAVEHYKPKSISKFAHLENDIRNLFYACSICNGFKGPDWYDVSPTNFSNVVYPDPSVTNYSVLFTVDEKTGLIIGKNVAGKYILERLFLNRTQLILDRKLIIAKRKTSAIAGLLDEQFETLKEIEGDEVNVKNLMSEIYTGTRKVAQISDLIEKTRPYTPGQIKKVKKK